MPLLRGPASRHVDETDGYVLTFEHAFYLGNGAGALHLPTGLAEKLDNAFVMCGRKIQRGARHRIGRAVRGHDAPVWFREQGVAINTPCAEIASNQARLLADLLQGRYQCRSLTQPSWPLTLALMDAYRQLRMSGCKPLRINGVPLRTL
jgi:hypothetical protein